MPTETTRLRPALLAALLAVSLALTGLALVQPAPAFAAYPCATSAPTRWVYAGCCISTTRYKQQCCNASNVWVDTGTTKCQNPCVS